MLRGIAVRGTALHPSVKRIAGATLKLSRIPPARIHAQKGFGFSCSHQTQANWSRGGLGLRHASTSASESAAANATETKDSVGQAGSVLATYSAPLAKTFFRLKLFSLGSLTLATALSPVLMLAPAEIGYAGRIGLCLTALATSGASTGLLAWIGKPYVSQMHLLSGPASRAQLARDLPEGDDVLTQAALSGELKPAIQALTTDWRLQKLQTTVYEPALFRPTSRPFATWELPVTPPSIALQAQPGVQNVTRLVAATRNVKTDQVIGRWWARWTRDTLTKEGPEWRSDGQCTEEGEVIRHFSIHENLLDEDWQVL